MPISNKVLSQWIKNAIYLYNNGSNNTEYLRGQVELAMYLLGGSNDDEKLKTEIENWAGNTLGTDKKFSKLTIK